MAKTNKSNPINVRISPNILNNLDELIKKRSISRRSFFEDAIMFFSTLDKNNPALKELLGAAYYEKYFSQKEI